MSEPLYCVYKPRTSCNECGGPVFLEGPVLSAECPSCFETLHFNVDFWEAILEQAYVEYESLGWDEGRNATTIAQGYTVALARGRQMPKCPACREALDISPAQGDYAGPLTCTACGKRTSSHPAPDWLRARMPTAERLFCAATEGDPNGAQELSIPDAAKPVMMACMNCGASLGITTESPRITTCSYCETENYLPDMLWRRLHPARKRVSWYVSFSS